MSFTERLKKIGIDTSWGNYLIHVFQIQHMTIEEQASFIAVTALTTKDYTEIDSPSKDPYYPRGFLKTTGKEQYETLSKLAGTDFIKRPELLSDRHTALKAVTLFYRRNGLNKDNAYLAFYLDKDTYLNKYNFILEVLTKTKR